ncbi:S41 family peptidase [Mucilaginibacter phyllosphaerae]
MKKNIYALLFFSAIIISSCSKDKKITPTPTEPSKTGSTLDLIKDSVYLYAKETYYWNKDLPTYEAFKPRSFTSNSDINTLSDEVDALSQYAINPETGKPYEYYENAPGYAKYSFIDDGSVSNELNGVKGDFGFAPAYAYADDDLRVKYVYPGSPADVKGIKRGYRITAINGRTGSGLTYDGGPSGTNTNVNFIVKAYANSSNITMTLLKPDNTSFNVTMSTGTYTVNPVLATKVITADNNKKIGYIVFNTFTSPDNAKPKLDAAFADFAAQGITDLVVDLRYNGGGYVATAEYLSDLIAPKSANGSLMYTTYYNQDLQNDKYPLLASIYNINKGEFSPTNPENFSNFSKAGSIDISRVFFIVTSSTASASELTINNLIPKMDVKLIGGTSYGKPVGFFAIDINKYQLYVPQFETKNSVGNGGYYEGMEPGSVKYPGKKDFDDVTKDFGDPTEALLKYAIGYVNTNKFPTSVTTRIQSLSNAKTLSIDEAGKAGIDMDGKQFKGMILNHPKSKK